MITDKNYEENLELIGITPRVKGTASSHNNNNNQSSAAQHAASAMMWTDDLDSRYEISTVYFFPS